MGGNSSKSAVEQTNEFLNETITEIVSKNSQTVTASGENIQTIKGANIVSDGCVINVSQSMTTEVTSTGKMESVTNAEISAQLQTAVDAKIDSDASQKGGFLSPAIANSAEAKTSLKTTVKNIIKTTMESENVQTIIAAARGRQDADFEGMTIKCYPEFNPERKPDLIIDQNLKSSVVAKGIADALTKALETVIEENTVDSDAKNGAKNDNGGLDDLVKAFGKAIKDIFGGITGIYVAACIACVIMLVIAIYMMPADTAKTMATAQAVPA